MWADLLSGWDQRLVRYTLARAKWPQAFGCLGLRLGNFAHKNMEYAWHLLLLRLGLIDDESPNIEPRIYIPLLSAHMPLGVANDQPVVDPFVDQ